MSWGFPFSHSLKWHAKHYTGAFVWRVLAHCHKACRPKVMETLHIDPPFRTCCGSLIFLWTQYSRLHWEFKINTPLRLSSGSPTSCHVRVINTFLSIMHAGGGISNIWLDNKSSPSVRERPSLWPSGCLLFFRIELLGICCWWGRKWWGQRECSPKPDVVHIQHCPSLHVKSLRSFINACRFLITLLTCIMFSLDAIMTKIVEVTQMLLLTSAVEYFVYLVCVP